MKSVTFGSGSAGGSLAIVEGALVYTPPATVDNSQGDVEETFSFTVTDGDDDTVTTPEGCELVAQALNSKRISLGAVGHACSLEAADAVNHLLGLPALGV